MHVLPRPIRPILRDAEATKVGVTHAQYRFARNPSQLQDGKPLTTEGVKRVSNLNRSQRLLGPKCSPRSGTGWCKVRLSSRPKKSALEAVDRVAKATGSITSRSDT